MENKLEKIGQNSFMDHFVKTDDILNDYCTCSKKLAFRMLDCVASISEKTRKTEK